MILISFWKIGDFSSRCFFDKILVRLYWSPFEVTAISLLSVAFVLIVLSSRLGSMDLVGKCKEKLAYFRIKELKDVLTQLNLAKQGKKQDLMDKILALLAEDQVPKSQFWGKRNSLGRKEVAKVIEDTYRKMQAPSATDLTSRSHSGSDYNHVKPKEEVVDSLELKVRCPCGSSLITESMIQCEDSRCRVWQHIGCVILPDKSSDGALPELPRHFYCELCRISRADPFWQTMGHPLLPIKLASSVVAGDGS